MSSLSDFAYGVKIIHLSDKIKFSFGLFPATTSFSFMHHSRLILHVDDDPDDRLLLAETIPDGYELQSLESGRALLDHLNRCSEEAMPFLILLDVNMPEMDGWETLRQLRNYGYASGIKVIMFTTASAMMLRSDRERFQVAVLTKPFNYSGLHECWEKVLTYAAAPSWDKL